MKAERKLLRGSLVLFRWCYLHDCELYSKILMTETKPTISGFISYCKRNIKKEYEKQ